MRSRRLIGMMVVVMLTCLSSRADMRDAAFVARELLGPGVWSRVLRIECAGTGPGEPAVIHALVFELEERLWYYAADSGTQSLSLVRDRLAGDKANLDELLRVILPGFLRARPIKAPPGPVREELPHGCFIECVAYLRMMLAESRAPDDARLLAYYGDPAGEVRGHTVLYFARAGRRYFFDPERSITPQPVPDGVPLDPLALALVVAPGPGYAPPQRAVFLPLQLTVSGTRVGSGRMVAGAEPPSKERRRRS